MEAAKGEVGKNGSRDKTRRPWSQLQVKMLTKERTADFWCLHSAAHGHDWCCCTAWWQESFPSFAEKSGAENKAFRHRLFEQGHYDGYILYGDEEPIGWCQCGPRDEKALLLSHYGLAAEPASKVQALSCIFLIEEARGYGLARHFVSEVIAQLRARDPQQRIQAYPRSGESLAPGEAWTGPVKLFEQLGFRQVGGSAAWPIYELPCSC